MLMLAQARQAIALHSRFALQHAIVRHGPMFN
jgi:hypothetical protein